MWRPIARQSDLIVKEVANELVAYDVLSNQVHCLSKAAQFVWSRCDGQHTVAAITDKVRQHLEPRAQEATVEALLTELLDAKLLQPETSSPRSRRDALKSAGCFLFAAAIFTMTSPDVRAQASPEGGGPAPNPPPAPTPLPPD